MQCSQIIQKTGKQCQNLALSGHTKCLTHINTDFLLKTQPKLLGSGTYGCVYQPPIRCRRNRNYNNKYGNHVMKVMDMDNAVDEIEIGMIIDQIDPKHWFFVPMSSQWCSLDTTEPTLQSCKSYVRDKGKNYHGHFMEYAGIPLDKYLKSGISVNKLTHMMKHMVNGLSRLHAAGICHLDIKEPNIMVSNDTPRLIDFGISKFKDEYTDANLLPFYELYPPFLSYVSGGYDPTKLRITYDALFKWIDPNYAAGVVGHDPLIEYSQLLQKLGSVPQYVLNVVKPNLEKVDIYMLGYVMINALRSLPAKQKKLSKYNEFVILCKMCTHPSVTLQYNMTDIIGYFEKHNW